MSKKRSKTRRRLRAESLESRQLLAANMFHNELMPEDVNEDGQISALDALTVINEMNRPTQTLGSGDGQSSGSGSGRMTDVNNDGRNSALDALMVINRLNRERGNFGAGDSGNDTPSETPTDQTDPQDSNDNDDTVADESSDVVLAWNDLFGEILGDTDGSLQTPGYASRSMAMLNLAIYDAVGIATDGEGADTFYDYSIDLSSNTELSAEVAASQAAYTVLSSLYPDQQETLNAFLQTSLAGTETNRNTDASLTLGSEIGNTILAIRASDGADVIGEYEYTEGAGYFQADPLNPDVPAWGPAWGDVDTFAIDSTDDFVPDSPPELTSEEYAEAYNEVLELGSIDSEVRTDDQTEAGIFWAYDREGLGTPLALYNDVLLQIAEQQGNTMEENAALFAQASVAMADAAIVAWDTKFSEEFWRPVTAIQAGDDDGNALTEGDADWLALGAPNGEDLTGFTPQFPTYISGHATFGGALFTTLQEFYGTDDIAFELTSEELELLMENPELQEAYGLELDDATRSFDSFSEAMAENGRSRVYLGIHFNFDDTVGQEVGSAIAASVASDFSVAATDDTTDNDNDKQQDRNNGQPQDNQNRDKNNRIASVDAALADEGFLF
ncbi:phosphoesterase PA-phosphatase related protein [Rhodopirellula maiorica SM1]|uniref:Phosphoesterase PA-phosphatase related protein n=1 Tax=Rhodopirellula maiorica SM1 TaxID=1265738 RepID=M5R8Y7_9BACT|nr:dockerin type I domain-containing protein [Rhodopirellula maiorica]EMI15516.1 phosphoesterase PA-phosphatase related protein [Rhodopirellula maiorica SM1]